MWWNVFLTSFTHIIPGSATYYYFCNKFPRMEEIEKEISGHDNALERSVRHLKLK